MGLLFPQFRFLWGVVLIGLFIHALGSILPVWIERTPEAALRAFLERSGYHAGIVPWLVVLAWLTVWSALGQGQEQKARLRRQVAAETAIREGFEVQERVIGQGQRSHTRRRAPKRAEGLDVVQVNQLKMLVEENRRLRRAVADLLHLRSARRQDAKDDSEPPPQ